MTKALFKVESSPEMAAWSVYLRSLVHYHSDDCRYDVFSTAAARARNMIVVPFFEQWCPAEGPILHLLREQNHTRIYGLGLEANEGLCLSAPLQERAVKDLLFDLLYVCLLTVKSEDFFMIHTTFNYSLLVSYPPLIRQIVGGTIENAFYVFERSIAAYGEEEPGFEFSREMVERYRRHNDQIMIWNR